MNGIHDMGGMHGLGPIDYDPQEPLFHAPWEARVHALNSALRAIGKWNIDAARHAIERLPPADYLRLTYYERWLARLEKDVRQYGLVTEDEFRTGTPAPDVPKSTPVLTPERAQIISMGIHGGPDPSVPPKFQVGDRVRARQIQPTGHTRLPRYARGKTGEILRDHGVYPFPDTNAHFQGEHRQHVYSVRFTARELWGEQASPRDFIHLDLWDDYLDHA